MRVKPVIFFDGVCGLCNRTIDWILKHDKKQKYYFAPLQGETARKNLNDSDTRDLDSLVLKEGGRLFRESSAVIQILKGLGPVEWILGSFLWLVPKPVRDLGYRFIAQNRYQWFGKRDLCRLPSPKEKAQFLP